jgi:hypothetical protein
VWTALGAVAENALSNVDFSDSDSVPVSRGASLTMTRSSKHALVQEWGLSNYIVESYVKDTLQVGPVSLKLPLAQKQNAMYIRAIQPCLRCADCIV